MRRSSRVLWSASLLLVLGGAVLLAPAVRASSAGDLQRRISRMLPERPAGLRFCDASAISGTHGTEDPTGGCVLAVAHLIWFLAEQNGYIAENGSSCIAPADEEGSALGLFLPDENAWGPAISYDLESCQVHGLDMLSYVDPVQSPQCLELLDPGPLLVSDVLAEIAGESREKHEWEIVDLALVVDGDGKVDRSRTLVAWDPIITRPRFVRAIEEQVSRLRFRACGPGLRQGGVAVLRVRALLVGGKDQWTVDVGEFCGKKVRSWRMPADGGSAARWELREWSEDWECSSSAAAAMEAITGGRKGDPEVTEGTEPSPPKR